MNKLIFLVLAFALLLAACSEPEIDSVPGPAETSNAIVKPPLELIDISKMPPLDSKRMQTSMEDALGNKNYVLADLLVNGKDSIPFLIDQLEDETEMDHTIMNHWYRLYVGDMAHIILTDFFTDETEINSTIAGFGWDEFFERGSDREIMGEEVLRRYIRKHGRKSIKQRWQKMWHQNKDKISWDENCRCFKIT